MEIINNNFSMKRNDDIKKADNPGKNKKEKPSVTNMSSDTFIKDTNNLYNEITSSVQRSLTKEQVILAGLETVRSFMESGMTENESIPFLEEIVAKTQFDNKMVLHEYRQSLKSALERGNPASIDTLIKKVKGTIESLTRELEMNEMKKQNLRSLENLSGKVNPEELMQKVIKSLKEEGLPEMKIPRERVADLLGE
jgi:hypothetical protein